jgi:hypothetical protein
VKAGDTFLNPLAGTSFDSHLWMVISEPSDVEECVIVNFTSWRQDKDLACVVEIGEHPYITKRTCVNYPGAKRQRVSDLEQLIAANHLESREPLSPELLQKIRDAVPESKMNNKCVELLDSQGLINW